MSRNYQIFEIRKIPINLKKLEDVYNLQISTISEAGKNNILMLCFDGLKFFDYENGKMSRIKEFLNANAHVYSNAYSFSTMTYESLVPVFSENSNQNTAYFKSDLVESNDCRFIKKALEQNRFVAIYGDGNRYINDEEIKYSDSAQCITEKIWDFINDLCDKKNGLFYLHELYESHYSFPNPYTEGKMVANGMAMLFDYLPRNGGKLQTDYSKQLNDSLKYLDDTLYPFIKAFKGDLIVFADHGNSIIDKKRTINDIKKIELVASEDWIRIPFIIKSKSFTSEVDNSLISLMELNEILLSILDEKKYERNKCNHIKIGRSPIYNPDFKILYNMINKGYNGEGYEGFIFEDGYKLIVYSTPLYVYLYIFSLFSILKQVF